ncbi:hypothetical protein CRYUN_Cryun02cG0204900 [Craigia yunnanensis]
MIKSNSETLKILPFSASRHSHRCSSLSELTLLDTRYRRKGQNSSWIRSGLSRIQAIKGLISANLFNNRVKRPSQNFKLCMRIWDS